MNKFILILAQDDSSRLTELLAICRSKKMIPLLAGSTEFFSKIHTDLMMNGQTYSVNKPALEKIDVYLAIDHFTKLNRRPHAVISLSRQGRELMAVGNQILGVPDIQIHDLRMIQDRLSLRKGLSAISESNLDAVEASPNQMTQWLKKGKTAMIRNRSNEDSKFLINLSENSILKMKMYKLDSSGWNAIYGLKEENTKFIMEEAVQGEEFSFTVAAFEGKRYILDLSEKHAMADLQVLSFELNPKPLLSIDNLDLKNAVSKMNRVFDSFCLHYGIYQLKMKLVRQTKKWEVMDIIPFADSTYSFNLFSTWLDLLTTRQLKKIDFHQRLNQFDFCKTLPSLEC